MTESRHHENLSAGGHRGKNVSDPSQGQMLSRGAKEMMSQILRAEGQRKRFAKKFFRSWAEGQRNGSLVWSLPQSM
eukprot:1142103-Pelagomonas_calceolata.AAC.7